GLAAEPQHDLGTELAKNLGQGNASLERVEEPAVGHVQVDPEGDSQDVGGLASLGKPDVRAWRVRGRLAVGQVDDANRVALAHQPGERSAAGNLDVVGMRSHCDQIEFLLCQFGHSLAYPSERPQRLKYQELDDRSTDRGLTIREPSRFLEWLENPGSVRFQAPGAGPVSEGALQFDFSLEFNHRLDPAC